VTIGDERIVKTNSEIEAMGVTVSLGFMAQRTVERADPYRTAYDPVSATIQILKKTTTGTIIDNINLYESIDYKIINNGTQVELVNPPAADTVSINLSFVNAVGSLEAVVEVPLAGSFDGENTIFTIPSGAVYGYYTLSEGIIISGFSSISGSSEPEDPFIVEANLTSIP